MAVVAVGTPAAGVRTVARLVATAGTAVVTVGMVVMAAVVVGMAGRERIARHSPPNHGPLHRNSPLRP